MRTAANSVKLFVVIQGVTEKFGQNTKRRRNAHIYTCPESFNLRVTAERVFHDIQCKLRHVSTWTAHSVNDAGV
jgi:hypothetical protein